MILYENERSGQSEYIYHQDNINLIFQKHAHYSFEVVFVLDGELICEIDNEKYTVTKNNALIILPGQIHSYKTEIYSKSYLCVFSNDYVERFYKSIKRNKLSNPVFEFQRDDIDIIRSDCNIFMKKSVLYRICSNVYEQSELIRIEEANFLLASQLAFYVQNNYTKPISLKHIAKAYGYNYNYLSTFFNTNFKQNFSAYVNQFRLQYAVHLLETTDKDITEIVSLSGFSTIRNFNIVFKNQYGVSPREYRKFDCG